MCGIFGFASGEGKQNYIKRRDVFLNGMLFNVLRGWDATGVAGVKDVWDKNKRRPDVFTFKRALHAVDFFDSKGAKRWADKFDEYHYVIGHTRAGTSGGAEDRNAHPFSYGDITLVHNGTVNQQYLPHKGDEYVDSAAIAATMAKLGEKETLELLDGAFSLVWYNQSNDTLNFARNKRKPMGFLFVKGKNEMYFGSEWLTTLAVLERNALKHQKPVLVPKPLVWYSFSKESLEDFTATEFKEFVRPTLPTPGRQAWENTYRSEPVIHQPAALATKKDLKSGESVITDIRSTRGTTSGIDRRVQVTNEELVSYGLSHGQILMFTPKQWSAHQGTNNTMGILDVDPKTGAIPNVRFLAYAVTNKKWNSYYEAGKYIGRIINVTGSAATKDLKVVVAEEADWQKIVSKSGTDATEGPKRIPCRFDQGTNLWYDQFGEACDVEGNPKTIDGAEEEFLYKGPSGALIGKEELERRLAGGCGNCDCDLSVDDHEDILWVKDASPLCDECKKNPQVLIALGLMDQEQKGLLQ